MTSTASDIRRLSMGRWLLRNTGWNLLGYGGPLVAALFAIPVLLSHIGAERFGVLSLTWAVVGYLGLFDLGLGRALTKLVAERIGTDRESEVQPLVWTALSLMLALGMMGAVVMWLLSGWLVYRALRIPLALQPEIIASLHLLAVSIPLVLTTSGLRGILEARQRFDLVNAVRVPMGLLTFVGPVALLPLSTRLDAMVAVLLVTRLLAWITHVVLVITIMPYLRVPARPSCGMMGPLIRFGGWMTVSNIVGPLMVYLDRFVIGAVLSVTAVAYYVTPYEVVTKMWLIPGALTSVLFPTFSSILVDRSQTTRLFMQALQYGMLLLFPITIIMVAFSHEGLELWLGKDFADQGAPVMRWLAVGVFINSLAQIPFALVQAAGRPDLTGTMHCVELPLYLVSLYVLLMFVGLEGAAMAWVGRIVLDTAILSVLARRWLHREIRLWRYELTALVLVLALVVVAALNGLILKIACVLCLLALFAAAVLLMHRAGHEVVHPPLGARGLVTEQ